MNPRPYILVVDDDPAIRRMIVGIFEDDGLPVQAASDGLEALRVCDAEPPGVVVLDLRMPGMDGRTFFYNLRLRGIEAPVMIVSAAGARDGARELGANDWLAKPFDVDVLTARVSALLTNGLG